MLDHTIEWLSENKFGYQDIDGIKYPTKKTIIEMHDFLVEKS